MGSRPLAWSGPFSQRGSALLVEVSLPKANDPTFDAPEADCRTYSVREGFDGCFRGDYLLNKLAVSA
ncbi:MAG: hypothetical protein RMJ98_11520 [Myxococcales bacterium]|nr:hypothetical protein [Polyangiaceae bacterium]MDW8249917.1 hypothetical protein [Myxococcales bacterium]